MGFGFDEDLSVDVPEFAMRDVIEAKDLAPYSAFCGFDCCRDDQDCVRFVGRINGILERRLREMCFLLVPPPR
jgi:hypothetical protein